MSDPERLGNWVIEERLGQGGMGSVYRASHAFLTRQRVALKWVQFSQKDAQARFEREVEALLAVGQHPHLAQVRSFDVLPDGSGGLLAMELVEGSVVEGPMDEEDVLDLLIQVGSAVAHAHTTGVIHRDIKPSNILHSPTTGYVLVDFGIARRGDDTRLTATGGFIGTLAYTAPEVWNFDTEVADDTLLDVYALGQVAYEMLTGESAIPTTDSGSRDPVAWIAHNKSRAVPLDAEDRGSAELVDLIKWATHPDPHQRLASADELVQRARQIRAPRDEGTRWVSTGASAVDAMEATPSSRGVPIVLGLIAIAAMMGGTLATVLGIAMLNLVVPRDAGMVVTPDRDPSMASPAPVTVVPRFDEPQPSHEVQPAPVPLRKPPRPTMPTRVRVETDPTLLRGVLVGSDGVRHVLPARVPAGSYQILATFAGDRGEVAAGEVRVAGSKMRLTCTAAFKLCTASDL